MIRRWVERLWAAWRACAAAAALFLAIFALALLASGTLPPGRLADAARALAGKGPAPAPAPGPPAEADWKRLGEAQRRAEAVLRGRRAEIDRLDDAVSARLVGLRAERGRLEEARRAAQEAEARLRARMEDLSAAEEDAEMRANLPILSRMDGASILELVKGWEDARVARYLRAMRPSKSAEVLEAMRLDPRHQDRAARVMEELKRPPGKGGG